MTSPLIYIITLNWNRSQDTIECVLSLQLLETKNTKILIVDNGSTDYSVQIMRSALELDDIQILELKENVGFAAGMNYGIVYALENHAEYVFVVNNDTVVASTMLNHLLQYANSEVGVVAPAIFYADQPETIWSVGGNINKLTLEMIGNHGRNQPLPSCPVERDFLSGCGLLITRSVFETVGFFDERFFMYYEDIDFCLRVQRAGFKLLLVPQAHLWHKVSQSGGGANSPLERYYMALSSGLYFRKHMHFWQACVIIPYRLLSALRWTGRLLLQRKWQSIVAYWRGLFVGWVIAKFCVDEKWLRN